MFVYYEDHISFLLSPGGRIQRYDPDQWIPCPVQDLRPTRGLQRGHWRGTLEHGL